MAAGKKHKAKKKRANGGLPDQTSRFPPPVAPETDIPSEQKGETNTHGHREIEERCIPVTYTYETSPEGAQVPYIPLSEIGKRYVPYIPLSEIGRRYV